MIEAIVPAQDGRILVYGDTDNGTVYCLVDPESEMVITRSETEQPFGIPFAVRADGEVLTLDPDEGALCCLDSDFHLVKTIPVQGSAAVYSSSENCAYILNGGNLVRVSPDGYEVHSTTELSPDEESAALISSLNRLDGILSVYPQKFYETFKTETGLGGLRFGFFASMRKPDLIAAGVTVQTAAWYNIFLDVNNSSDAVIHHEIWHAVEKRAEGDGFIISDTEWSSYNPDGFFYRDETDTPLPTDRSTILVYGAGDASSFVEEYSTYAMHEDRATIIEYFFQDGQDYLEQYDTLTAAPLLKKKLDLMAAVTRPVFGTVYWEDIAQALKNGS